jgi:hypothetical protein
MTLLTPLGLLLALAAVVPVAAWLLAERRAARIRETLGLDPPARSPWIRPASAAAVPLLLALACAQPVLTREDERRVRTDAAAMVLVDVSRSMQARAAPGEPTRLERARDLAVRVRDGLSDVPVGLASMTDRTVPLLLPSADANVFEQTVRRALASESPPPREVNTVASTLGAIADTAGANLFLPGDRRRVVVVLTDGESRPFAKGEVARALRAARIDLVTVHIGDEDERVYRDGTIAERLYRPDPQAGDALRGLAAAAGGTAVEDDDPGGAVRAAAAAFGDGPTRAVGGERRLVPLAPWLALLALVPLLVALEPRVPRAKGLPAVRQRSTIGGR